MHTNVLAARAVSLLVFQVRQVLAQPTVSLGDCLTHTAFSVCFLFSARFSVVAISPSKPFTLSHTEGAHLTG